MVETEDAGRDDVIKDVIMHGLKADPSTCNEAELRFVIQQKTSKPDQWKFHKKELLKYLHRNLHEVERQDIESIVQEPETDLDDLIEVDEEDQSDDGINSGQISELERDDNGLGKPTNKGDSPTTEAGTNPATKLAKPSIFSRLFTKDNDKEAKEKHKEGKEAKGDKSNVPGTPSTAEQTLPERIESLNLRIEKAEKEWEEIRAEQAEILRLQKLAAPSKSVSESTGDNSSLREPSEVSKHTGQ